MSTTQQHLPISDIKEDIVFLKDGGAALILQVSAVNFGLLSQREQVAIISAFAQMLNSLSFSIQIVILSERLNISSYLAILDKAQKTQTNILLSQMMSSYRQFIQKTIKENDVLDKKFFLMVPIYNLELGLTPTKESLQQKIKTILFPRRDQIIRQLSRVGLRAQQLESEKLVELFFDIYNGEAWEEILPTAVNLNKPKPIGQKILTTPPAQTVAQAQQQIQPQTVPAQPYAAAHNPRNHPFIVEELKDES